MREIEHHLDAIQMGVEGALDDYERSDPGRFLKPEEPRQRPTRHDEPERETFDHETGLAELAALTGEGIDVAAHPEAELPVGEEAELLAELDAIDPHYLAALVEVARLVADEFGDDELEAGID